MRIRKRHVIILVLIVAVSLPVYLGLLQILGNFHTVAAGKLYRSAQPSAQELAGYAQTLGIKSVINLRGPRPGEPWYDDEMRVSKELGLYHADVGISATQELSTAQIEELEKALRDAPAPLLLHCKSGADRTGLAAALYVLDIQHQPAENAAGQLSWMYGHWPFWGNRTAAMDRTLEHAVSLHPEVRPDH